MQQSPDADVPALILNLMRDTFQDNMRTYFLGAPTMFADAALPSCSVTPVGSNISLNGAPTGRDRVIERIDISFAISSKDTLSQSDSQETSIRTLYNMIQGRDPATGYYLPQTAVGALRSHLTLLNPATGRSILLNMDQDINYDVMPRPDQPMIVLATVTVTTEEDIDIPQRY